MKNFRYLRTISRLALACMLAAGGAVINPQPLQAAAGEEWVHFDTWLNRDLMPIQLDWNQRASWKATDLIFYGLHTKRGEHREKIREILTKRFQDPEDVNQIARESAEMGYSLFFLATIRSGFLEGFIENTKSMQLLLLLPVVSWLKQDFCPVADILSRCNSLETLQIGEHMILDRILDLTWRCPSLREVRLLGSKGFEGYCSAETVLKLPPWVESLYLSQLSLDKDVLPCLAAWEQNKNSYAAAVKAAEGLQNPRQGNRAVTESLFPDLDANERFFIKAWGYPRDVLGYPLDPWQYAAAVKRAKNLKLQRNTKRAAYESRFQGPIAQGVFSRHQPRKLKTLRCIGINSITSEIFGTDEGRALLAGLESLTFKNCDGLVESQLDFSRMFNLKELHLAGGTIEGECLQRLPATLESLSLAGNLGLKQEHLSSLKDFTGLKKLGFSSTSGLKGDFLEWLPVSLETLDLTHCSDLDPEKLQFLDRLVNLRELHIDDDLLIRAKEGETFPSRLEAIVKGAGAKAGN